MNDDGRSHGHSHGPSPAEAAAAPELRRRLAIACGLVLGIVVLQGVGAVVTGSLALLVDVVHSLTDSIGLFVALIAAVLMSRPAGSRSTWGFRRIEVLAALGQALLLMGISVYALLEAYSRWSDPPEVASLELLVVASAALLLNGAAVWVLAARRGANLNMRAAFLEVLLDALGTLAVIASAVVMMTTGYQRADVLAAVVIALMIVPRAALLISETVRVLMEFAPRGLDVEEVRRHLLAQEHVVDVHDLHASTVATGLPVLSAHVVLEDECFHDGHAMEILEDVRRCTAEHFDVGVEHTTFQLETRTVSAGEPHHVSHP
ncbi:MAG: cation diffusion facilitator family transporter [Nesterenkonia sp.]|nr:cation diffusion facilitator family transporter [Nesterenkonia sp.]